MKSFTNLVQDAKTIFPLVTSPLIQCITNEITCESMANALLYIDAKPVMADEVQEFPEFFQQNDGILLNLGHISTERVTSLREASKFAAKTNTPAVVDLVGVAATELRYQLALELEANQPQVIKGNISEMRRFLSLKSAGRGVDAAASDQEEAALQELAEGMAKRAAKTGICYLATGEKDLLVTPQQIFILENGVPQLDRFTGTGDIVGSIITALLGTGIDGLLASFAAVSYFNCCGEQAGNIKGLAAFRQETLNQLSLLMETDWSQKIVGKEL